MRIEKCCVVLTIAVTLIFAFPLFSSAQSLIDQNHEEKENAPIKNSVIKKGDTSLKEENKEDNQKEDNNSSKGSWRSLFFSPAKAKR